MLKTLEPPKTVSGPFDDLLGYHLRRLSVLAMTDLTESLSHLALRPAEASILFLIAANPKITQSEVGRALGILRANMAPLMATLIKRGWVERKPVDGRSQALRLTGPGQTMARKARAATRAHEDRLFGSLAASARARLIAQLRVLWQR